jgi:hypothetical protein
VCVTVCVCVCVCACVYMTVLNLCLGYGGDDFYGG